MIKGLLLNSDQFFDGVGPLRPGCMCLMGDGDGLAITCPDCGQESYLPFKGAGPCWEWDGDPTSPTLLPSIKSRCCGWHGYLRAGNWVP